MAVLVEAISIIVRVDALDARYPGGWPAFRDAAPNMTLCCDGEIARVGFMTPDDVQSFVARLEATGLVFRRDGAAVDMVVVDQQRGPTTACDWLDFGKVEVPGGRVSACRLRGSEGRRIALPERWRFEDSLSATFGFVPEGQGETALEFLRREDGLDVYRDRMTGREVFVARSEGKDVT